MLLVTIGGPVRLPVLLMADWSTPFSAASRCTLRSSADGPTVAGSHPVIAQTTAAKHHAQGLTAILIYEERRFIERGSPRRN
jgi:hypothetical protein